MQTVRTYKKELPLTITRKGVTYSFLSPIERYAIEAQRIGIAVLKLVVMKSNDWDKLNVGDIKNGMYMGVMSADRCRQILATRKTVLETYYYIDKKQYHLRNLF